MDGHKNSLFDPFSKSQIHRWPVAAVVVIIYSSRVIRWLAVSASSCDPLAKLLHGRLSALPLLRTSRALFILIGSVLTLTAIAVVVITAIHTVIYTVFQKK